MAGKVKISSKHNDPDKDFQFGYRGNRRKALGYDPVLFEETAEVEAETLDAVDGKNQGNNGKSKRELKAKASFELELGIIDIRETLAEPEEKKLETAGEKQSERKAGAGHVVPPSSGAVELPDPEKHNDNAGKEKPVAEEPTAGKEQEEQSDEEEKEEQKQDQTFTASSDESSGTPEDDRQTPGKDPAESQQQNNQKKKGKEQPVLKTAGGSKEPKGQGKDMAADGNQKQSGKKTAGGGGGGGGRITDMTDPSKDGGVERNKQKDAALQQAEQQHLEMLSKKKASIGSAGISKLSTNEQKKDPAGEKLKKTEDAVVEQQEEKVSEVNAKQVDLVAQVTPPEAKKEEAQDTLKKSLDASVPKNLEDVDKFKERGIAGKIGEQVQQTIEGKTQEISGTFEQLEKTDKPGDPKKSTPLGEIEKSIPTAQLNVGSELVPPVKDESINLESYVQETDNVLKREGIKEEHLNMVDSGDLFEARKAKDEVEKKSKEDPAGIRKEEQQVHSDTEKHLDQHEKSRKEEMQKQRGTGLGGARKDQENTKSSFEKKKEEVTNHINGIYEDTNRKVQEKLDNLKRNALAAFDREEAEASRAFEENVKTRLDKFKDERYSGLIGKGRWLKDKLLGMDDLPEVKEIFESERTAYINRIDSAISRIIGESQKVIDECKSLIAQARKDIEKYVKSLGPELRKIGEDAQKEIQKKLDELDEKVNKAAEELKKELEKKRAEAIKKLDEKIEKMKEEMSGLLSKIGDLLLDAALKFFKWALESVGFSADSIMGVINKGKAVITAVVTDPARFIRNLAAAVGNGVRNFGGNIMKHLKEGFMSWLTGQMSSLPIQLPEKFDVKGIFSIALQVIGLTWANFRNRLSNKVGEEKVSMAEKATEGGLEIISRVKNEGPSAMYDMMAEQAENIKGQVIEGAKEWAITNIVKQGIIKVASMLNPAGAIVQAILAIYNGVMFFINNWQRIVDFVNSVFDSIAAIASGAIAGAAAFIEKTLASTIPMILDFMARLLGLGGIGDKIHKVIQKVQKPVNNAMDKVINFIAEKLKKLWDKITGKNKKKKESKEDTKKDFDKDKGDDKTTDVDREEHKKYVSEVISRLKEKPKAGSFEKEYNEKRDQAKGLEKEYDQKLKDGLKTTIRFEALDSAKKDHEVSVKVIIAPNNSEGEAKLFFDPENDGEEWKGLIQSKIANNKHLDIHGLRKLLDQDPQLSTLSFGSVIEEKEHSHFDVIYKDHAQRLGRITTNRYKLKTSAEDSKRQAEQELQEIDETFRGQKLTAEERAEVKKMREEAEAKKLERDVYTDLLNGKDVIVDSLGQYTDRFQRRYLSQGDLEFLGIAGSASPNDEQRILALLKSKGIEAKGKGKFSLKQHVKGQKDSPGISITKELEYQITGGSPEEPTFNDHGAVELDLAKLDRRREVYDLSTEKGTSEMVENKDTLTPKEDGGLHQGMVDVRRTREVIVSGKINPEAITDFRSKETVDIKHPEKLVEKKDENNTTANQRMRNQQKTNTEEAIQEIQYRLEWEAKSIK